jgi:hypothetical protein
LRERARFVELEVDHHDRGVAFDQGHPGQGEVRVFRRRERREQVADVEVLVLNPVKDLVGHGGSLQRFGQTFHDVEFAGSLVIETGDLFGEQIEHELAVVEVRGEEPHPLEHIGLGFELFDGDFFVEAVDQDSAELVAALNTLGDRLEFGESTDLGDTQTDGGGGFQKLLLGGRRILYGISLRGRIGSGGGENEGEN